jgi:hypothetical protein
MVLNVIPLDFNFYRHKKFKNKYYMPPNKPPINRKAPDYQRLFEVGGGM